jgi:hypothetical protein
MYHYRNKISLADCIYAHPVSNVLCDLLRINWLSLLSFKSGNTMLPRQWLLKSYHCNAGLTVGFTFPTSMWQGSSTVVEKPHESLRTLYLAVLVFQQTLPAYCHSVNITKQKQSK